MNIGEEPNRRYAHLVSDVTNENFHPLRRGLGLPIPLPMDQRKLYTQLVCNSSNASSNEKVQLISITKGNLTA